MSQPSVPGGVSRGDPDLTDRQRQVFAALVTHYGDLAHPVGSETLSARAGVPLSPASIRSALADLESMGLLERSHASSGRVPTARGYEVYVRALLMPAALPATVAAAVDQALLSSRRDVEHLLTEAS